MATRATPSRSTTERAAASASSGLIHWVPKQGKRAKGYRIGTRTVGGPRDGHLHLDWVRCATRLSDAQCDEIIEVGRRFPLEAPTVVGENILSAHRVGHVHLLQETTTTRPIYRLLWNVAADAAENHFGLAITGITRMPHYVEYVPGYGHFHWHNDYSHESSLSPRKLTVVIQLSDRDDYEGGDLEIFNVGPQAVPRERGTMVCLPSFVAHRVTPVTSGIRRIVVAWIAGPRLI